MGKYIEIQNDVVARYNIELCDGTLCSNDWSRTHAHVKQRRVCKWKQVNSIQATFELLHEIGHIETTKSRMRRCESEYYATVWALNEARDYYKLVIPNKTVNFYQDYIFMERARGVRRGGNLPPMSEFIL